MAKRKKWDEETILNEIRRIMTELKIDHIPTQADIRAYSTCIKAYQKNGGARWASKKLNVPAAIKLTAWTPAEVLDEIKRIQKKLGIQRLPKYNEIKKYSTCYSAYKGYGGATWAKAKLSAEASRRTPNAWTLEKVIAEIKYVMQMLNIKDRMPTYAEISQYSTCYGAIRHFGGSKAIADAMGLTCEKPRKKPTAKNEMQNIKPSKAFEIQRKAHKPYGQIQQEETLAMVGTIDLSAYAGMQTYAERTAIHG